MIREYFKKKKKKLSSVKHASAALLRPGILLRLSSASMAAVREC